MQPNEIFTTFCLLGRSNPQYLHTHPSCNYKTIATECVQYAVVDQIQVGAPQFVPGSYCTCMLKCLCNPTELPAGVVTVSSAATAIPVTPLTPLTPAMVTTGTPLQVTQALSGVTFALPTLTAIPTDASLDQRRNWWHIEEVCTVEFHLLSWREMTGSVVVESLTATN